MKIQPMRDRIVVLQDANRDDITTAVIIVKASKGIVTSQQQFGRQGTVMVVGDKVDKDQLKVGDRVLYGEFANTEYWEDNIKYIVLSDQDIVGVID